MEFQEILDSRRSIRSYDAAKKVTKEQVEELIEAALQAPSWKNSETARYHCVLNEDVIAKIREEALPAFNQKSSAGAALIVATFVKDDRCYTAEKGMNTIRAHAADLIRKRLAPAEPLHDGKQTPMRGHPVFLAQHATATCCRNCLEKWHHIPKGKELTEEEQEYVVDVIMEWIRRQMQR